MKLSRRTFIKGAAAVGAFNLVPARVLRGATAPSNQLTRALIGYGGVARSVDLERKIGNHMCPADWGRPRIIAIVDPDARRAKNDPAADRFLYQRLRNSARYAWDTMMFG